MQNPLAEYVQWSGLSHSRETVTASGWVHKLSHTCWRDAGAALTRLVGLDDFLGLVPHGLAVLLQPEEAGLLPGRGAHLQEVSPLQEELEVLVPLQAWTTTQRQDPASQTAPGALWCRQHTHTHPHTHWSSLPVAFLCPSSSLGADRGSASYLGSWRWSGSSCGWWRGAAAPGSGSARSEPAGSSWRRI